MARVEDELAPLSEAKMKIAGLDGFIFDYGGVLVTPQTPADRERMAAICEIAPGDFDPRYWAKRDEYDRGHLTASDYWNGVADGRRLTPSQLSQLIDFDTAGWMHWDEPMWHWLDELQRAGKRLAMLSNMPLDLGEVLKSQGNRLDRFDNVTLSYEVRSVKPEPLIYEQCLAGIGTEPGRTLFVDDRPENVQGAEALGLQAMVFTSRENMLLRLQG